MADFTEGAAALWRPAASLSALRLRADVLARIRYFFAARQVLEIDTPILGRASVTDPHIESLKLSESPSASGTDSWYLQTSPEFAMKRLLAAGSGDIYQIAHVFRQGESGRLHNPEFSMLEWYRLDYDHHRLMDEVEELLTHLCQCTGAERLSYADAFGRYLGLDPHNASTQSVVQCACDLNVGQDLVNVLTERDQWLDLLMSRIVGPKLGRASPAFIFDFPASQAALAKINSQGYAQRFELFLAGVEIANGYHELTDAEELLNRFNTDNLIRRQLGLRPGAIDYKLLAAMQAGLPDCAGVAIGLDRLLMWLAKEESLEAVIGFPCERI